MNCFSCWVEPFSSLSTLNNTNQKILNHIDPYNQNHTQLYSHGVAILYPAPCIIMVVPPQVSRNSIAFSSRTWRLSWSRGSPVPVETKRQSDDFTGDSNASRDCGGYSSWRFDEGWHDVIVIAIYVFLIEHMCYLIREQGFFKLEIKIILGK